MTLLAVGFAAGVLLSLAVIYGLILSEMMRPTGPRWPLWVRVLALPFYWAITSAFKLSGRLARRRMRRL